LKIKAEKNLFTQLDAWILLSKSARRGQAKNNMFLCELGQILSGSVPDQVKKFTRVALRKEATKDTKQKCVLCKFGQFLSAHVPHGPSREIYKSRTKKRGYKRYKTKMSFV
jgi:hypothetical protein